MSAGTASRAPLVHLGRAQRRRVALVGNPNTGKSTLFNVLTGLRQKVANYPGVTVEVKVGTLPTESTWIELVDLPGTYTLAAHSPDELLAIDLLLGRESPSAAPEVPEVIVLVVDATNLERNLFLVSQVLELGVPVVVALTMTDLAEAQGLDIDRAELSARLGVPVVPVTATHKRGVDELTGAIEESFGSPAPEAPSLLGDVRARAHALRMQLEESDGFDAVPDEELLRALIDRGAVSRRLTAEAPAVAALMDQAREDLGGEHHLIEREAEERYRWASEITQAVVRGGGEERTTWSRRIDRLLAHPFLGAFLFLALMAMAFQAVFSWATPVMELIDGATSAFGRLVESLLPAGAVTSLISDGVIAGVGAVVIFLPQIVILFLFILILEDSGYMARGAFMIDRLMRACGLSGQSFIPMLSSFACAVPGILATRVIPNRRDRLATILAAPFMTCSARLPVYALLIAAFVPQRRVLGILNLQGLVLLGLYLLGMVAGVLTALVLKRTLLRGPTPTFLIEMPPYRWPSPSSIAIRLWQRVRMFLVRAGTIIFAVTVVVWALAYFPRPQAIGEQYEVLRQQAAVSGSDSRLSERLEEIDRLESAAYIEQSALGRLGKAIAPVFRPLGWDWKVSAGVLASLPAREVVLAALGTIYAVGEDAANVGEDAAEVSEGDEGEPGLRERFQNATWPDGRKVFSLPMALGLMVFFALCLQCGATVAAIRRESGSWRWPIFAWVYMTVVAYLGALVTYQLGRLWLG